jgi:hypothetical protein
MSSFLNACRGAVNVADGTPDGTDTFPVKVLSFIGGGVGIAALTLKVSSSSGLDIIFSLLGFKDDPGLDLAKRRTERSRKLATPRDWCASFDELDSLGGTLGGV